MSGGRVALAVLLGVAGGLLLGASTAADWFAVEIERDIGGVAVPDERGVAGGRVAGELLVVGLAAGAVALGLAVVRGRARQVAAVVLGVLALGAAALTARGLLADVSGAPAAGAAMAVVGTLGIAAAGVLALRRTARPRLSARYDLDADDADDEWHLASADDADTAGRRGDEARARGPRR